MSEAGDWHWRNTMRPARFFAIDARAAIGVGLVIVHIRLWTLLLALVTVGVFWIAERANYDFEAALRYMRSYIAGPRRPNLALVSKRRLKDYGK